MTTRKEIHYPEINAGGYSRVDGTLAFYARINSLVGRDMTVLDYGAGRGQGIQEDPVIFRRDLRNLRGKCKRFIGVDIDPAVKDNPGLDEAYVMQPGQGIPLSDESVDLIVSDYTFEHIVNPEGVSAEFDRVLKHGGWICARTPNRWGYIALGASLVPNALHVNVLRFLQPHRQPRDVFPTAYKLNTATAINKHFPSEKYRNYSYRYTAEPAYFGDSRVLWGMAMFAFKAIPSPLAPTWMVLLEKK